MLKEDDQKVGINDITLSKLAYLSEKYQIPITDLIVLCLNLRGISVESSKEYKDKNINRARYNLDLIADSMSIFRASAVSPNTPFKLIDMQILIENVVIGEVHNFVNDTCDETYFRKNGLHLTLNSNSRSKCSGCKFCGTYTLNSDDANDLTSEVKLKNKIEEIMKSRNKEDLTWLHSIGAVTGCFKEEKDVIDHLIMIKNVFSEYGFDGEIQYIGSQICSRKGLERLAKSGQFSLYLTVECFENRQQLMRKEKTAITLERGREILKDAKELGMDTSFLYILGLDSIKGMKDEFRKYKNVITRHPLINIFQNYVSEHERLRDSDAMYIDYYINAMKIIEDIYLDTKMRPRLWENYRSPWTTKYGKEAIDIDRI